jgi:hypothetical protein
MGYADGTPAAAGTTAQATEGMALVNESPELETDRAASTLGGPAPATQTSEPEPDTVVPGSATRASNSSKNVSFNLLQQQQQQPGYSNHGIDAEAFDDDNDDDDDDDIGGDGDVTSSVRVAVRIRPFLPSETGTSGVIDVLPSADAAAAGAGAVGVSTTAGGRSKRKRRQEAIPTSLQIGGPAGAQFTYDAVHGTKSTQADLYLDTVRPLVRQCLKGCELSSVRSIVRCKRHVHPTNDYSCHFASHCFLVLRITHNAIINSPSRAMHRVM